MRFVETKDHKTALSKTKNSLVLDMPFYSVVALMVPIKYVVDLRIESAAAVTNVATDGSSIWLNPEWFMGLSARQRVGLLCHEVEHIVRLHSWRMKNRDPELWNIACDAIINNSIQSQGMELPEMSRAVASVMEWCSDMTEEQVYVKLLDNDPRPEKQPGDGEGGGQGDEGWGNDLRPGEASGEAEMQAREMGRSAAAMAKAVGKLPSHLQGLVDSINESRIDWRELMSAWMAELAALDYTWARPNRTWLTRGVRLPGEQSEDSLGELGIVLDQSGSMSTPEVRQSFAEVCGMVARTNPRKVVVVYIDSEVAHVDVFDNPSAAEIRSKAARRAWGGTDMVVGLDYLEKEYPNIAGAVVMTDGDTPFGSPRSFPVMWAMTQSGKTAPWGTTVPVEVEP